MKNIKYYIVIAVVAILLASTYFYFKPAPGRPGEHTEAVTSPVIVNVPKEEVVVVAPLVVYTYKAKEKLKLPQHIQAAPEQRVVAATKAPNDERQHTVTTLVNTNTGEFTTFDRVEPNPWLAVNTKTQVGAYIGLKNGTAAIRLQAQQDFLQIKALRVGAVANVDLMNSGKVDTFIGVGASVRW